ncbi:MAG: C-GCAxxG-C-C family protein [Methanomassiliicoccaceae archaeon]|nr:C-GCAxxG-C-C family protein [Methanomassiliicoccaceae archaeon]
MLTEEYVAQKFREGIDCSMLVLAEVADVLGLTKEEAYKVASCFGAGMYVGGPCGAVTGAFIAIGMKHGNYELNDTIQKHTVLSRRKKFIKRFEKAHGSVYCPALLGADLRDEEQRLYVHKSEIIAKRCPKFCLTAVDILRDMLSDDV